MKNSNHIPQRLELSFKDSQSQECCVVFLTQGYSQSSGVAMDILVENPVLSYTTEIEALSALLEGLNAAAVSIQEELTALKKEAEK